MLAVLPGWWCVGRGLLHITRFSGFLALSRVQVGFMVGQAALQVGLFHGCPVTGGTVQVSRIKFMEHQSSRLILCIWMILWIVLGFFLFVCLFVKSI